MSAYVIGVDFGTLSARAIVVETATGRVYSSAVADYPHGVLDERLPDGTPLGRDWALQHPGDYLTCLRAVVPEAVRRAGIDPRAVVGLGFDCTASTSLPVDELLEPLCFRPEFEGVPHAWPMLWKHHAAQDQANRMTDLARARGDTFLERYGGRVSSEWLMPKLLQILEEAPEVYDAAWRFMDLGDWLVARLTGEIRPSACIAGYKGFYLQGAGYPPEDYFRALHPRMADIVHEKLFETVYPMGARAGHLTREAARALGLREDTAVAVANIDAHAAVPAAGLERPGDMLFILGTSGCHLLLGDGCRPVPGICGAIQDGFLPGMMGYESGQSCLGDHFAWFEKRCVPAAYARAAEESGESVLAYLTRLAARQRPGEHGLIALDWWNGNRCVLADFDLTGLMLGMTLATKPEDIYRALIEATAFGTRVIIDNYAAHDVPVERIFACGGIAKKNPLLMQIYADVLNRELRVASSDQACALGAAIFAASAAGSGSGGFDSVREAAARMASPVETVYRPDPASARVYDALYDEYRLLHDTFGRGGSDVMKRLKALRESLRAE